MFNHTEIANFVGIEQENESRTTNNARQKKKRRNILYQGIEHIRYYPDKCFSFCSFLFFLSSFYCVGWVENRIIGNWKIVYHFFFALAHVLGIYWMHVIFGWMKKRKKMAPHFRSDRRVRDSSPFRWPRSGGAQSPHQRTNNNKNNDVKHLLFVLLCIHTYP